MLRNKVTLLSLCIVALLSTGASRCEGNQNVGNQTCLACHDGRTGQDKRAFLLGAHESLECESCHGPGQEHTRNAGRGGLFIDNPADYSFLESINVCSSCHERQTLGFFGTGHAFTQSASCQTCHDVHTAASLSVKAKPGRFYGSEVYARLCVECHQTEVDGFVASVHGQTDAASCRHCHDMHVTGTYTEPFETNAQCLKCHGSTILGFVTDDDVDFHTGPYHPVDPAGTGSSRCTACHMPNLFQELFEESPHDHTLFTIPPVATNDAIMSGVNPAPPNSCSGVTGCHDPGVANSGLPFDVNDIKNNSHLQILYEMIGLAP